MELQFAVRAECVDRWSSVFCIGHVPRLTCLIYSAGFAKIDMSLSIATFTLSLSGSVTKDSTAWTPCDLGEGASA